MLSTEGESHMEDATRLADEVTWAHPVFDNTYTGPRWTYGLVNRPMQIGAQPKGSIIGSARVSARFKNFGTVQWPRRLTDEEVASYELVPVVDAVTEGGA
jgi:hypothetical protein